MASSNSFCSALSFSSDAPKCLSRPPSGPARRAGDENREVARDTDTDMSSPLSASCSSSDSRHSHAISHAPLHTCTHTPASGRNRRSPSGAFLWGGPAHPPDGPASPFLRRLQGAHELVILLHLRHKLLFSTNTHTQVGRTVRVTGIVETRPSQRRTHRTRNPSFRLAIVCVNSAIFIFLRSWRGPMGSAAGSGAARCHVNR